MNRGLLDIYSDYLISQNGCATATGLSSMLDGQISHDKITRFLNTGSSTPKDLGYSEANSSKNRTIKRRSACYREFYRKEALYE